MVFPVVITGVIFVFLVGDVEAMTAFAPEDISLSGVLSTIGYECAIILCMFVSWFVFRATKMYDVEKVLKRKRGIRSGMLASEERDTISDHVLDDRRSWPKQNVAAQKLEAERCAAKVLELADEHYTQALRLFRELVRAKQDRFIKDERFYFTMIQSASRVGHADVAEQLLHAVKRNEVSCSVPFFQSVLKLFASKQFFKQCLKVHELFRDHLPLDKTVLSCISFAATQSNDTDTAMEVFERMRSQGSNCELSEKDYVNLFRVFAKRSDSTGAVNLLRSLVARDMPVDTVIVNIVLAACVSARLTSKAHEILKEAEAKTLGHAVVDVVSFNTVLKGYSSAGKVDKCFELLGEMAENGVSPDELTYGTLLDACILDGDMNRANGVLGELIKSGLKLNTVLYTTLMKGFVRTNRLEQAMVLFQRMKENLKVKPDLITYSILIKANCEKRNMDAALSLLDDMMKCNYQPDEIVVNHLIDGCCHVNNADLGVALFTDLVDSGKVKASVYTISTMVKLFGKTGRCTDAAALVETMEQRFGLKPTVVIFTCLISGLIRNKRYAQAFEMFGRIQKVGVSPDRMTYQVLLDGCRQSGEWKKAVFFAEEAFTSGLVISHEVLNQVLNQMLAKSADEQHPRRLARLMTHYNIPSSVSRSLLNPEPCDTELCDTEHPLLSHLSAQTQNTVSLRPGGVLSVETQNTLPLNPAVC